MSHRGLHTECWGRTRGWCLKETDVCGVTAAMCMKTMMCFKIDILKQTELNVIQSLVPGNSVWQNMITAVSTAHQHTPWHSNRVT